MNAHAQAMAAYAAPDAVRKTPRAVEYDIFARVTAQLRRAQADGPAAFPALAAALDENRRLWVALAADLATPDNALPDALRGQLLGLAQFTLTHTSAVLAGQADAQALVDTNLAIMRGLAGTDAAA